jgi:preprotein translocase subunit SecA
MNGNIKDTKILFEEIKNRNPNFQKINNIYIIYERIKSFYSENMKSIKEKELKKRIREIKQKILQNPEEDNIYIELISIMIKVNKIVFYYKPREIQIIAVLFFLFKEKDCGLIEEILTGEGKTIIISFLAVIKALQGKKVDILTSSTVLAERDAKEMSKFYNYFGLSVDYCNKDFRETFRNTYLEEIKERQECFRCYKADIVYGDPLSFEGDILRTNFMGLVGRGRNRSFDCIIIDEIDNICIDNIKNITELLDNFHGYKFLEYVYLFIYKEIVKLDEQIRKKVEYDEIKHELYVLTKKKDIVEELIKKAKKEFCNLKYLSERKNIYLPEHLGGFINCRLKKWCESAYDAMFIYKENREYIIAEDETYGFKTIKPVDFSNTGVIQENSVWTGLHQFLQIKEGLRLTEESLNSCYMSNFTFFKKYISKNENNIYGLTGTVGSKKTQEALNILYKLNLLFIPTFKEYKLKIYNPIIEKDIDKYERILIEKIRDMAFTQGRAVLVIFKYIALVSEMYKKLIQNNIP